MGTKTTCYTPLLYVWRGRRRRKAKYVKNFLERRDKREKRQDKRMDLLNFYSSSDEEDNQNNFRCVEQGTPVSLSQKKILANSNVKSNFPPHGYWIMDITPYFTQGEFEKVTKFVWNKKRFKTIFNEELALGNTFGNDNKRFISEAIDNKTNGGIKALNECLKQLAQFCNSQPDLQNAKLQPYKKFVV